jgi:hypothetical protein
VAAHPDWSPNSLASQPALPDWPPLHSAGRLGRGMPATAGADVHDPTTFVVAIASEVGRGAARARTHCADPTRSAHPTPMSENPMHSSRRVASRAIRHLGNTRRGSDDDSEFLPFIGPVLVVVAVGTTDRSGESLCHGHTRVPQ